MTVVESTDPICVALATDENYVQHMCVTLLSLLHNRNTGGPAVHIYVLSDGLSDESIAIIRGIADRHDVLIHFPEIDFEEFSHGVVFNRHHTRTTYGRLALPKIVKADKILYLDCDVIVRDDVSQLWDIDISEYYLGAVVDSFLGGINGRNLVDSRLGIPAGYSYFNAGVLLMNLKKWRQDEEINDRFIKFSLENTETRYVDQDVLNAILWGKWYPLHPRWNVQRYTFRLGYERKLRRMVPIEFIDAVKNPAIVHYTSAVKPWHYECRVPYVEEYYKYLAMTPWRDYRPSKTLSEIVIKNIKMLRRRLTGAVLGYRV